MRQSLRSFATSSGTGLGLEEMVEITRYYNAGLTDAKNGNFINRPPDTIEYVERMSAYKKAVAEYQMTLEPIYWMGYEDAANQSTARRPTTPAALIMYNKGRADRAKSGGTIRMVSTDKKAGTVTGGAPMTGLPTIGSGDAKILADAARKFSPASAGEVSPATAGFGIPLKLGIGAAAVGLLFFFFKRK